MSRKVFILMAITLAAATAATAATALADTSPKQHNIGQDVAESVRSHSNTVQQIKARNLRLIKLRSTSGIKITVSPRR